MKKIFSKWLYEPVRSVLTKMTIAEWCQVVLAFVMLVVVFAQAVLLHQQNKRIDEQIYISQASPAWQALPQIQSLAIQLRNDADRSCIDEGKLFKAAKTLGDLVTPICWGELARIHASTTERYRWLEVWNRQHGHATEADFDKAGAATYQFEDSPASPFDVQGFELVSNAYLQPSPEATASAEVVTEAMLPYRSLDTEDNVRADTPELTARPVSRERALVLKQFLNNGYYPVGNFDSALLDRFEFVNVQLLGIELKNTSLRCASFSGSDLRFSKFDGADLSGAKFSASDLRSSSWDGAILDNVSFGRVLMPAATDFRPASLKGAHFEGAIVDTPDWPSNVEKRKPPILGFNASEWLVTPDNLHRGFTISRRGPAPNVDPMRSCDK